MNESAPTNLTRLTQALDFALTRYQDGLGTKFPWSVEVKLAESLEFHAEVAKADIGFVILVSSGCINHIDKLWRDAWQSPIFFDDKGERLDVFGDTDIVPDQLASDSLTWLMLHELMHISLRHLDILGTSHLVETEVAGKNNIYVDDAEQYLPHVSGTKILVGEILTAGELSHLRPSLEMQADGEATEIMLGAFHEDSWQQLRIDAVCIFVVMALIEKANSQSQTKGNTHPSAATRFFTLMAQLFQFWLYPGAKLITNDGESFVQTAKKPNPTDFERYSKAVLVPLVNDAVYVAMWAEAKTFLVDLGDKSELFRDIFTIQYADDLETAELKTNAARMWRELHPINEKILIAMGLR